MSAERAADVRPDPAGRRRQPARRHLPRDDEHAPALRALVRHQPGARLLVRARDGRQRAARLRRGPARAHHGLAVPRRGDDAAARRPRRAATRSSTTTPTSATRTRPTTRSSCPSSSTASTSSRRSRRPTRPTAATGCRRRTCRAPRTSTTRARSRSRACACSATSRTSTTSSACAGAASACPEQWYGDFLAGLGAARIAERRLEELCAHYGVDVIRDVIREWFDYSERRMEQAIKQAPERHAPRQLARTTRIRACPTASRSRSRCGSTPRTGRVELDLRDNPDNYPGGLNESRACSMANAMIGLFNSIDPDIPHNAGSLPARDRAPARGLHRRHPAVPALVLDGDDERGRSAGLHHAGGLRRDRRRLRPGRGRHGHGAAHGGRRREWTRGWATGPTSTRCSSARPAAPARRRPTAGRRT